MPRRKEFDREEVLLKAMMVFRDKGYAATSMQDLVRRMGINRFSLYQTFKSKHELFVQALHAYYENVAMPFFARLRDSDQGLRVVETTLLASGFFRKRSNQAMMALALAADWLGRDAIPPWLASGTFTSAVGTRWSLSAE